MLNSFLNKMSIELTHVTYIYAPDNIVINRLIKRSHIENRSDDNPMIFLEFPQVTRKRDR